jgi:hypothetical protein
MELQKQQREADSMKGYSREYILELKKQREQEYNDQLTRITDMVLFASIFCRIHDFIFLSKNDRTLDHFVICFRTNCPSFFGAKFWKFETKYEIVFTRRNLRFCLMNYMVL